MSDVITDVHNMLDLFKTRIDELQCITDSTIKEGMYEIYWKIDEQTTQLMIDLHQSAIVRDVSMELMQRLYDDRANKLQYSENSISGKERIEQAKDAMVRQKELERLQQALITLEGEQKQVDNEYDSEENKQKIAKAQEKYNEIKNTSSKLDENFRYVIDMECDEDQRILKFTNDVKLPQINQVRISKPSEVVDLNLEKFFKYSIPQSLELFCFNWGWKSQLNIKDYTDILIPIIKKTTKEVFFQK